MSNDCDVCLLYRLSDKEDEIKKLQSELQTKLQETSKLNTDLETQKQKNNVSKHKITENLLN